MDWSIVHSLNGFLYHNDPVEDPLLAYVNAAEALYLLLLVVLFLFARHERRARTAHRQDHHRVLRPRPPIRRPSRRGPPVRPARRRRELPQRSRNRLNGHRGRIPPTPKVLLGSPDVGLCRDSGLRPGCARPWLVWCRRAGPVSRVHPAHQGLSRASASLAITSGEVPLGANSPAQMLI